MNRQPKLMEWLNIVTMISGIAAIIFVAGRKDAQLDELKKIASDMSRVSIEHGNDIVALKAEYMSLKERLDAFDKRR